MALLLLAVAVVVDVHLPQVVPSAAHARETDEFEREFWSGGDLNALYQARGDSRHIIGRLERIFEAGFREFAQAAQAGQHRPDVDAGRRRAPRDARHLPARDGLRSKRTSRSSPPSAR